MAPVEIPSITTAEGIVIRTLRSSPGGTALGEGDRAWVYYSGSLANGTNAGTVFDQNFNFNGFQAISGRSLFAFKLGAGQVIQGWDIALADAHLGDVLEVTIPAALAYGSSGRGPLIPPNSDLKFTIMVMGRDPAGTVQSLNNQPTETFDLIDLGLWRANDDSDSGDGDSDPLIPFDNPKVGTLQADVLNATDKEDQLFGLAGPDVFKFQSLADASPGENHDVIVDFNRALGRTFSDAHFDGDDDGETGAFTEAHGDVSVASAGLFLRQQHFGGKSSWGGSWGGPRWDDRITNYADLRHQVRWRSNGSWHDTSDAGLEIASSPSETDKIDLSAIDANSGLDGKQPFTFIGDREFSAPGQLRYDHGLLQGNVNGDLAADLEIGLRGAPALQASMLIL